MCGDHEAMTSASEQHVQGPKTYKSAVSTAYIMLHMLRSYTRFQNISSFATRTLHSCRRSGISRCALICHGGQTAVYGSAYLSGQVFQQPLDQKPGTRCHWSLRHCLRPHSLTAGTCPLPTNTQQHQVCQNNLTGLQAEERSKANVAMANYRRE